MPVTNVKEFINATGEYQNRVEAAVTDIESDVTWLKTELDRLNNNPGTFSPEDQAIVDSLIKRVDATTTKLENLSSLTPPPAPPIV